MIESKKLRLLQSVILVILIGVAGFSIPTVAFNLTRAREDQIISSGTPIQETEFSNITSEAIDPVIYKGVFNRSNTNPSLFSVSFVRLMKLNNSELYSIARDFIGDTLFSFLEPTPHYFNTSVGPPLVYLRFIGKNQSNPNGVLVGINPISKKVAVYIPRFENGLDIWPVELRQNYINENQLPADEDQIKTVFADFLKEKGYTLHVNMRVIEIIPYPNENNPSMYKIEIAYERNSIAPDEMFKGVIVYLDALTGYIINFEYRCIEIPEIDVTNVINPDLVRSYISSDEKSIEENYQYMGANLRMLYLGQEPDEYSLRFQLGWVLKYANFNLTQEPLEFPRDAYDGNLIDFTNPRYVYFGDIPIDANIVALLIPVNSMVIVSILYFTMFRRKEKY